MKARLLVATGVLAFAASAPLTTTSHALPCAPENEPICTVVQTVCSVLQKWPDLYRPVCTLG